MEGTFVKSKQHLMKFLSSDESEVTFACEQEHINLSYSPTQNTRWNRLGSNLDFSLFLPCVSLKVSLSAPTLHVKQDRPQ